MLLYLLSPIIVLLFSIQVVLVKIILFLLNLLKLLLLIFAIFFLHFFNLKTILSLKLSLFDLFIVVEFGLDLVSKLLLLFSVLLQLLFELRSAPSFVPLDILFHPPCQIHERIVVYLLNLLNPVILMWKFLVFLVYPNSFFFRVSRIQILQIWNNGVSLLLIFILKLLNEVCESVSLLINPYIDDYSEHQIFKDVLTI